MNYLLPFMAKKILVEGTHPHFTEKGMWLAKNNKMED